MQIAVNCRFLHTPQTIQSRYAAGLLLPWIQGSSDASLLLVADGPINPELTGKNRAIQLAPHIDGAVSSRIWYDIKLPALLKKENCAVYIGSDGHASITAKAAQLLLLPRLAFLQYPRQFRGEDKIGGLAHGLKKAAHIIVASGFAKQQLVDKGAAPEKISVIPFSADAVFQPVSWSLKEKTKAAYAGGCEYFVCYGTHYPYRNTGVLLKAFSIFKKWQKSNMKLLLVGKIPARHDEELDKLDSYKFKDDVVLLPPQHLDTMAKIVASSYAVLQPASYEDTGLQAIEAMACEVPVVAAGTGALPELCGDAALFTDATDANTIGQQMIRIYKDENLRNTLIQKGRIRSANFQPQATAGKFAAVIGQLTASWPQ